MTPKKTKGATQKAKRDGSPAAKEPTRKARKATSAESAPAAPAAPPPVPATPAETPAPAYRPFVQFGDLAPLALFEVGLAIGKVEMFCAVDYASARPGDALIANLGMEEAKFRGCRNVLLQYLPAGCPSHKIMREAHEHLERMLNHEPIVAQQQSHALWNEVDKIRRLKFEEPPIFELGRMIGNVAHDGFFRRNPFDGVSADCLRRAVEKVAANPRLAACGEALGTATKPILARMASPTQKLPNSELEDTIRSILAAFPVSLPTLDGSPDTGPSTAEAVDALVEIVLEDFPVKKAYKAPDVRITVDGKERNVTAECALRFLVIHHANSDGNLGLAFEKGKEAMLATPDGIERLPGSMFFLKDGRVVKNYQDTFSGVAESILGSELRPTVVVKKGKRRFKDKDKGFNVERWQNIHVTLTDPAKESLLSYCSTFHPEATDDIKTILEGLTGEASQEPPV